MDGRTVVECKICQNSSRDDVYNNSTVCPHYNVPRRNADAVITWLIMTMEMLVARG